MTTHARTDGLLAAAIDYRLTPAEQTELADHLASCPTCRAQAAGYRSDASALRAIAYAEPPAHVRAAVLRAASRRPARTIEPWKLLVAAALLLTALLGGAAALGAWNSRPSLVLVVPIAAPSVEPSAAPRPARWTATGGMIQDRSGDTATLLSDGKVLAVGGSSASGSPLVSAELYDPSSGSWAATANMPTLRRSHTATLLPDGRVLVAGGDETTNVTEGGGATASAELYDPNSRTWTATGNMVTPRLGHTAMLLPDGKVLAVGGGAISAPASAELYDPGTGSWTATGSMVTPRAFHTATLLPDGKVLVAGGSAAGSAAGSALDSAELYDPANGTWTATGRMVTARGFPTATLLPDGKVLVAGGNAAGGALDSAELYDPANGTWTTTGRMVTRRTGDTATLLPDGTVLVAGGNDDVGPLDSAELYDPGSGTWSAIVKMLAPRQSHTATLLPDGTVLVAGGDHGVDPPVDTPAELYDPGSGTSVSANPSPSPVPAALQVACDGSTTAISTPLVKAQADGIHIQLANSSGRALTFAIENQFGGESIPVGGGTYVYTFGPGSYRLSCVESGSAFATFEVVDPDGFYTPIACDSTSGGSTIGNTDYVPGATGPKGKLLDVVRTELRGLQPADVVERAGYPKAAGTQWVRVVRDGHVVTVVGYLDDGHGGWLIGQTGACSGSNVTVVPPG